MSESNENFIARLNDDVLLEIFLRICSEKPQNAYPKYPYSALQLSLVCSRWRAVLLASPRMWTNITVICCSIKASRGDEPGPAENAHHAMIQEEITNLYVQRSRGWLISIFVCKSTKSPRSTDPPPSIRIPISDRQIDLLCQATGWKEINFLSTGHSGHAQARSWRRLLEKGASCCKTLDTVVLSENSTMLHTSPAFSLASNLHNLYVHGLGCCRGLVYESSQSDFPFNKIRLLAINGFPTRSMIEADGLPVTCDALRCFPYLRDLIVTVPPNDPHDILYPSMLYFSYLTSLNLWVDYNNQGKVKNFLSNISSPCLRSFALKYRDNIVQHPLAEESVISFLSTCSRSLRSFTLEKVPIRASTLINILSVVPGLTHLEIRDLVPGSFIPYCPISQALATYMEANPMFLADLEAMVLIWQREDTEGKLEKALMEMVETRRVYGKLKEVSIGRLNPYEEISVDTNHRLAALKQG
ncbi:uncharacterized protein ARMOST_17069 [Armillaria ostoyae]|uniref:Uncharacterized protein n=1 Tax=Armillaria ostoyae TaxID=47428 RepID=A0A284RXZ2_ARMOS|nr:uncharacterized protein ARMOST_17069 [Armillaria ostoyae]